MGKLRAGAAWRESISVEFGIKLDSDPCISGVRPGRKRRGLENRFPLPDCSFYLEKLYWKGE